MVAARGARNAPLQECCLRFVCNLTGKSDRVSLGLHGLSSAKHAFLILGFFYSGWLARKESLQPQLGFSIFLNF